MEIRDLNLLYSVQEIIFTCSRVFLVPLCWSIDQCAQFVSGECEGWCWPLYIYIALAVLQLAAIPMMKTYDSTTKTYTAASTVVKFRYFITALVWNLLIGFLLYYLCKKCHNRWAWFVLLLPIIFDILLFLLIGVAAVTVLAATKTA